MPSPVPSPECSEGEFRTSKCRTGYSGEITHVCRSDLTWKRIAHDCELAIPKCKIPTFYTVLRKLESCLGCHSYFEDYNLVRGMLPNIMIVGVKIGATSVHKSAQSLFRDWQLTEWAFRGYPKECPEHARTEK